MAQMQSEEEERKDVEPRDERAREAEHHHRVNVVMPEGVMPQLRKARIGRAKGEVEQVKNDEGEDDEPADGHAPRGEGGLDEVFALVMVRPGTAVLDHELDREINVQNDHDEERAPNDPKERPKVAQVLRVAIDPLRPEEDLEVAEKMADDEKNQDQARHRHDYFPANG